MKNKREIYVGTIFGALGGGTIGLVVSFPFAVISAVGAGHGGGVSVLEWLLLCVPPIIGLVLGGWLGGRIARRGDLNEVIIVGVGIAGVVAFLWLWLRSSG